MLNFLSLAICENYIFVNIFGHNTYPEASLCTEEVLVNSKHPRHCTDVVTDMWFSMFYFQKIYFTEFPKLRLLKTKQHAQRKPEGRWCGVFY